MDELLNEAVKLDKTLQYLATYAVTGGNIVYPVSQEEVDKLNIQIANKFNYFKKLIRNGECTLEFISSSILQKYGAFKQDNKHKNIDDIYNNIVVDFFEDKKSDKKGKNKLLNDLIDFSKKTKKKNDKQKN